MAIKGTPNDWVTRWKNGVGAAGARYTQGVQQSADWAAAATSPAAVSARNAGLQRAMSQGTIEAGIQRMGTNNWRNITAAKSGNWQTGVNTPQAQQNAINGFQRLYGYLQNAEGAIANLPRGGFAENMQRFTTYATSVHNDSQRDKGLA